MTMSERYIRLAPWQGAGRDAWAAEAERWLARQGRDGGLGEIAGVEVVKERPWSAVWRVEFANRVAYFKACCHNGRHEPPLLRRLAASWGDYLSPLLAIDDARHWLLLDDAGSSLHQTASPDTSRAAMQELLPIYARLQQASLDYAPSLPDLVALPDRRLPRLPALLDELMASGRVQADDIDIDALQDAVATLRPAFERTCLALADSPFALALDHGDFHVGNVLVRDGRYRLCDWGDACVTHPFASMLVVLNFVLPQMPENERVAQGECLVGTYLEAWKEFASETTLRATLRQTLWISQVLRVMDYDHMLRDCDQASWEKWKDLIPKRLLQWVEHYALLEREDDAAIYRFLGRG